MQGVQLGTCRTVMQETGGDHAFSALSIRRVTSRILGSLNDPLDLVGQEGDRRTAFDLPGNLAILISKTAFKQRRFLDFQNVFSPPVLSPEL